MSVLAEIARAFSSWLDTVAQVASGALEYVRPTRCIEVIEEAEGGLTIRLVAARKRGPVPMGKAPTLDPQSLQTSVGMLGDLPPQWIASLPGSRIELMLRPSRFLFCPLELPTRAAEFLAGIVRGQLDILTPWNPGEAAFGFAPARPIAPDRITTTVVATGRTAIATLAQAFSDLGAAVVEVTTEAPDGDRVVVYSQRSAGLTAHGRIRVALIGGLVGTGMLAVVSNAGAVFAIDNYDAQQQQLQRQISQRRAALRNGQAGADSSAVELLERRKQTMPSSVMVIEALSALLPDHTYTTEVHIDGDKLQIVGLTRDAPGLIEILERSPHFANATFFAPTTHAQNETGDRFHIEAKIKPYFGTAL